MPFIGKNPNAGFATIVKDTLTADGSTTQFTLSKQVASTTDIAVFVGNVRQEPTTAYTVNGTTLDFGSGNAPATGLDMYVLHIGGTQETSIVPADGTISSAKIVSGAVTSAKIDTSAVTTAKVAANAVTYAKVDESSMRDKYFREIWALTDNHTDDTQMIGYNTANIWALNTDYAGTDHGSHANTQRMLTPGHVGGGDTMHSAGGVTGKEFFQFPENGIYSVTVNMVVYADGADGAQYIRVFKNSAGTPVNSQDMARFYSSASATNYYQNMNGEVLINISDYENDYISFSVYSIGSGDSVRGEPITSRYYESHIIFARLGDVPS